MSDEEEEEELANMCTMKWRIANEMNWIETKRNETKWNESNRIELNQIGWTKVGEKNENWIETRRNGMERNLEIRKLENRKEIKWRSKFIMFAWITSYDIKFGLQTKIEVCERSKLWQTKPN